ncbi:unnamed protein product [Rotaria magnacalcarata]|uniref:Uncharacterized protein n=3 Tax=Rotaria magnacalcarata TaxID=392030 RepID=A0A816Y0H2_9BILA|nr:unnamed protein product [Rotaria magnacalcarata]CAF5172768.1 unnamed protein product [Rotaria magnacalcarata]
MQKRPFTVMLRRFTVVRFDRPELLHRLSLQEKSPIFELRDQDFPLLTTSDNHSNKRWNIAQPRTTIESNFLRTSDTEKIFQSINDNLAMLIDSSKRLENKVDLLSSNMKTVTLDTQLHQAVLADNIHIMKDFIQYFIRATFSTGKIERVSLVPVANEYYSRFHAASSRLINGFQLNHQVQLILTSYNNTHVTPCVLVRVETSRTRMVTHVSVPIPVHAPSVTFLRAPSAHNVTCAHQNARSDMGNIVQTDLQSSSVYKSAQNDK